MKIPLMRSAFTMDEGLVRKELANFVLTTGRFSMGEECLKFEIEFAHHQGIKYCVLFNSGSSANLALLQALKNLSILDDNSVVGVSALTWATNVMPILQLGMYPFPLDCSLKTLNVMFDNVQGKKMNCLFITNALGFCGDLDRIKRYCGENQIVLIEDNCESLGSELRGTRLGNFGLASTFSFYVAHHLSTIEGGAVCTSDTALYNMLKMVRSHGWGRDVGSTNGVDDFYERYTFYDLGYNLRPTEFTGFLGSLQLGVLNKDYDRRAVNFEMLSWFTDNNPDFLKLDLSHMNRVSNFAFPVLCKDKDTFNKYKNRFVEKGIEIRPIIAGNIQNQPFYKKYMDSMNDVPNTNFIHENGFYFCNNSSLNREDFDLIKGCLE